MIGTIYIKCNAAKPQMSLPPIYAFINSPSSIRIAEAPKKIGNWKLTEIYLQTIYPDNSIHTVQCVLTGGVWVGTIPACSTSGKSENGFTVLANGIDENGEAVTGYVLGKSDVFILDADSTITDNGTTYYLHLLSSMPESANTGDVVISSNGAVVYDGSSWQSFGISYDVAISALSDSIDSLSSKVENTESSVSELSDSVSTISASVENTESAVTEISDSVDALSVSFESVCTDVYSISAELSAKADAELTPSEVSVEGIHLFQADSVSSATSANVISSGSRYIQIGDIRYWCGSFTDMGGYVEIYAMYSGETPYGGFIYNATKKTKASRTGESIDFYNGDVGYVATGTYTQTSVICLSDHVYPVTPSRMTIGESISARYGDVSAIVAGRADPLDEEIWQLNESMYTLSAVVSTHNPVFIGTVEGDSVTGANAPLSVIHISDKDYENLVISSAVLSNALYIVSSDCINAYGEKIVNLGNGSAVSDAVNYGQLTSVQKTLQTQIDDIPDSPIFYGTCSTAAGTAAKVVVCSSFTSDNLVGGTVIYVKFTYYNNQTTPTLNVNSTGAKNVKQYGTTNLKQTYRWTGGAVVPFVYDGSNWIIQYPHTATTSIEGTAKLLNSYASTYTDGYALCPAALNNALTANINPTTFSTTTQYYEGDCVYYNNLVYRCTADYMGAWNTSYFSRDTLGNTLTVYNARIRALESSISSLQAQIDALNS